MKKATIDRRQFVKLTAFGGGELALGIMLPPFPKMGNRRENNDDLVPCDHFQPSAYIRIDKKGQVMIFVA